MWTRVTGWLGMVTAMATLLWWQLPHGLIGTPLRDRLVVPLAGVGGCLALWLTASAFARRRARRIALDKLRWPKESRILPLVLAFAAALFASSALISAVGPDGAEGRHVQRLQEAGGGLRPATVASVVSKPQSTGTNINDHDVYRATLILRVPFDSGPQDVTVPGVETLDKPAVGDEVDLLFAPDRPDLGVIPRVPGTGFAVLWIWILALFAVSLASYYFYEEQDVVHGLRRSRAVCHLPALALLGLGVLLQLPVMLHQVDTLAGWLLCLVAAATPVAAIWWLNWKW